MTWRLFLYDNNLIFVFMPHLYDTFTIWRLFMERSHTPVRSVNISAEDERHSDGLTNQIKRQINIIKAKRCINWFDVFEIVSMIAGMLWWSGQWMIESTAVSDRQCKNSCVKACDVTRIKLSVLYVRTLFSNLDPCPPLAAAFPYISSPAHRVCPSSVTLSRSQSDVLFMRLHKYTRKH